MSTPHRQVRAIQSPPYRAAFGPQLGGRGLKSALVIASSLVILLSGAGYAAVGKLGNDITSASGLDLGADAPGDDDNATDILLVGRDTRAAANGDSLSAEELQKLHVGDDIAVQNTDTLMVVRIPDNGGQATAVSIPRDTYIDHPEFGHLKINAVYNSYRVAKLDELSATLDPTSVRAEYEAMQAGRSGLLDAIHSLTGVQIDHYAEVGLSGFAALVDAVGGVEVCLNAAVSDPYSGADFPAGVQTLDGYEALAFVRQRHGLPNGDFDRMTRQQAVLASMADTVLSTGTLTNPQRLADMSQAIRQSVALDQGWDLMSFATQLSDLASSDIHFATIPVTATDGVGDNGESVVTVDVSAVHEFFRSGATGQPTSPASQTSYQLAPDEPISDALAAVEVHVLNAGSTDGLAAGVGGWLGEQGLTVTTVGNATPGAYFSSQIVASDSSDPAALELSELLGGLPITEAEGVDGVLIVVTADNFTGPTAGESVAIAPMAVTTPMIGVGGSTPTCIN
ncbi:LCP family protein [Corynebacterium uterequi]|uniref:Transcriptional attenuator, LytR family n=1 Tax=Corynebacterium uterequi TaxID=1072256 RepID=A0A0G3HH61_9CORY|nr:LCP family protein [Corynebacterium uterequi]AKK10512.1 transcriptional attenuator, LytR family [Corynebacterium uterequi]